MPKSPFTMEVTGIQETLAAFRRIFNDIDTSSLVINALSTIGFEVKAKAQELLEEKVYSTPPGDYVRTGLLKANIDPDSPVKKAGELSVTIRAKQNYAVYVELGTSKMIPRAFLLPAAQGKKDEVLKILTDALTDFLKLKAKG